MQLDAKKSPLALLAQTCSSIGKDSSPSKTIIPPIEKKEVGKGSPEKPGSRDGKKSASEEKKDSSRDSHKPSSQRSSAPPKEVPPLVPIASSSDEHSRSPPTGLDSRKSRSTSPSVTSVIQHPISATTPTSGTQSNSRISLSCGNMLLEVNHHESSSSSGLTKPATSQTTSSSSLTSSPYSSHSSSVSKHAPHPLAYAAAGISGYPSSLSLPLLGHGVPIDSLASSQAYHSSLGAHAGLGLSGAAAMKYGASSVSPYVAYARVRTPAGGSTLVPICRDPYCTNCQLTLQNAHLSSTCTASGCAQCAHEKALTAASYPPSSLGLPSGLPLHPGLSSAALAGVSASNSAYLSSLYPHSMLSAAHGLPYVCNWVSGSDYCGKRFPTSEELLQHLRTHTSASDVASLPSPYSFGLPSASALAACHSHLTAPGSLSPNSIRRGYPLSLSPVSNMLGSSRYHPYKSPLAGVPQVPGAGLSHSTLGAYYSPYTLYGQRLGAAAVP